MAIYHCSLRIFSRSEGHSAVAAAAYRAGAVLKDERSGIMHRYHKRTGVADTFILAPHGVPQNLLSRAVLWNAAEASETRKNSRVAREVILALPHELTSTERQALARDMALYLVERYRVAVDVAIHTPVAGDGHDPRNHHAHLLFTTREVTVQGFGAKTRILDDKESGPQEVELLREVWETLANDALAHAGFPEVKIDRRTLEGQGVERIPQSHVGKAAKNTAVEEHSTLKNRLKGQFQQTAEETESDEETEGSTGKTGKSEGGAALTLKSKTRQDHKGRTIDYKAIDQQRSRLSFNEEIKTLNTRRVAFSPIPLLEQIKHVETLTGLLESRQKHLKTLLIKSSLPHAIRARITAAFAEFKRTLFADAAPQLSADINQARAERQQARYGRTYRAGLQERMRVMEDNINRLERKYEEYSRFKAFIDTIENDIRQQPKTPPEPVKPQRAPKRITPLELSTKLTLRAEFIREHIPERFHPATAPLKTQTQDQQTPDPYAPLKQAQSPAWFIPASDKTRPLQRLIENSMREAKATQPLKAASEPAKSITNQAVHEKVRAEARIKRERIPPRYRAQPYDEEKAQAQETANAAEPPLQQQFESRAAAGPAVPPTLSKKTGSKRKNLSETFNASAFEAHGLENHTPAEPAPEM